MKTNTLLYYYVPNGPLQTLSNTLKYLEPWALRHCFTAVRVLDPIHEFIASHYAFKKVTVLNNH
jgi:hypothetical protein